MFDVVDVTPLLIGAALIGTAVTTTGMFLFISAQRRGQQVRGTRASRHTYLATGLISAGAAITMVAWYLWPKTADPNFDPNELLRSAPPAAIPATRDNANNRSLAGRQWVLLIWGTPNDVGQAAPEDEMAFNRKLAELFTQHLTQNSLSPNKIETRILSREESNVLAESPKAVEAACTDHTHALILTLRLTGHQLSASSNYTPWREPQYRLIDCRRLSVRSHIGRVIERRGDTFPYQQALGDDFRRALKEFHTD
jgi:hypothetical protein